MSPIHRLSPEAEPQRPVKVTRVSVPETLLPVWPQASAAEATLDATHLLDVPMTAEPVFATDARSPSPQSPQNEPRWGYQWADVAHCFAPDNTLTFIDVIDTTLEDWRSILLAIAAEPWTQQLVGDGEPLPSLREEIPAILSTHESVSYLLSVKFRENTINTHFYHQEKIVFDFDCFDIYDQQGLDDLFTFCHTIQQSCHKRVEIYQGFFVFDEQDGGRPTGPFFYQEGV